MKNRNTFSNNVEVGKYRIGATAIKGCEIKRILKM